MEQTQTGLAGIIEREIADYFSKEVNIADNYNYSQPKLIRRIIQFENRQYPNGKFDSQGNYKYWFDIIKPRIEAEIKNIDFDTRDIDAYSDRKEDEFACLITNLKLKEWLRETGQGEELNSAIEQGSGWGNVVWKRVRGGYERSDLKNLYVINQTACTLDESAVIERHQMTQSEIRKKASTWNTNVAVEDVLKDCGEQTATLSLETQDIATTNPYYDIYERNGEVRLSDLKQARNEVVSEGDEYKYVLAKVIAVGVKAQGGNTSIKIKHILYANTLSEMPYLEYHRGRYQGRWFREGLIELLFDLQVRANGIGNQLARGLEWASKTIFTTESRMVVQNVNTDLKNGDIITAKNLQQLAVRMEGFDQLANEWNRILELANEIANSREVVMGDNTPSGTPFRTTSLLNSNANKLFDFIREKIGIPFSQMFERWVIPELIADMSEKEILRVTGDSDMLDRLREAIVNAWYVTNLVTMPPHDSNTADAVKELKLAELKKNKQILLSEVKSMFENFKPHVAVIITGEQSRKEAKLESLKTFITLEADPVRRQALIEMALKEAGFDVKSLPKAPPAPPQPTEPLKTPQVAGAVGK